MGEVLGLHFIQQSVKGGLCTDGMSSVLHFLAGQGDDDFRRSPIGLVLIIDREIYLFISDAASWRGFGFADRQRTVLFATYHSLLSSFSFLPNYSGDD